VPVTHAYRIRVFVVEDHRNKIRAISENKGWIRLCSYCCRGYHFVFIVHWT